MLQSKMFVVATKQNLISVIFIVIITDKLIQCHTPPQIYLKHTHYNEQNTINNNTYIQHIDAPTITISHLPQRARI